MILYEENFLLAGREGVLAAREESDQRWGVLEERGLCMWCADTHALSIYLEMPALVFLGFLL